MKHYKINPTKKQLKIIKNYWERFRCVENYFYRSVAELEREMSKATKIKDLEFFWCDNECVGIGNGERTMRLIHREEL